jgi:hypothetical protein
MKAMTISKITTMVALLLLVSVALAVPTPAPVIVQVIGTQLSGWDVKVTHLVSGHSEIATTNEGGFVQFEWSSYGEVRNGDKFRIEVADKVTEATYNGIAVEAVVNLGGVCPSCSIPVDTTPYDRCDSCCPVCQSKICTVDGTVEPGQTYTSIGGVCNVVVKANEAPVQDKTIEEIVALIVGLIVGGGAIKATGVKVYTDAKGNKNVRHSHANYVAYHKITDVHPYQPHKVGELSPKYSKEKDSLGKYKYIG